MENELKWTFKVYRGRTILEQRITAFKQLNLKKNKINIFSAIRKNIESCMF